MDTKRGYVGKYEERFTQQVFGVALSAVCMLPGSLVPRLFGGGGKGLGSTACACTKITPKSGNCILQ